jgi:hypothetical protein
MTRVSQLHEKWLDTPEYAKETLTEVERYSKATDRRRNADSGLARIAGMWGHF